MAAGSAQTVYFIFQIFGLVTLPCLACTVMFYPTVKRHTTVTNNAIVWILSSFVSILLLITGQLDVPEPPRTLCRIQSAFMLGQAPAVSAAALAMVWKVWSLTWKIGANISVSEEPVWLTCILISGPYIVWAAQAAAYAIVQTKSRVHQITFYCTSDNPTLGLVSSSLAGTALVLCLVFQGWTMILVYRRFSKTRRLGRSELGRHITAPFFIRTIVFMVMVIIALILCFVTNQSFSLEAPDIIIASCGPITFFIFASQEDILVLWKVKRPRQGMSESRTTASEVHSKQDQPPVFTVYPSASVGATHGQSRDSIDCNYPEGSKGFPHIAIRVERIELSTVSDSSSDKKPRGLESC